MTDYPDVTRAFDCPKPGCTTKVPHNHILDAGITTGPVSHIVPDLVEPEPAKAPEKWRPSAGSRNPHAPARLALCIQAIDAQGNAVPLRALDMAACDQVASIFLVVPAALLHHKPGVAQAHARVRMAAAVRDLARTLVEMVERGELAFGDTCPDAKGS